MSESQTQKFDGLSSVMDPGLDEHSAPRESALRKVAEWPLVKPLHQIARSIRDTVNCSVDAVRGRYDM